MSKIDDRVETVLPATVASPSVARRFVGAALRRWHVRPDAVEAAQLLTSEVVTNAIVHAGSDVRVVLLRRGSTVRVEVTDHGEGTPQLVPPDPERPDGRGLGIVDQVSTSWGSAPRATGKAVWFDVEA